MWITKKQIDKMIESAVEKERTKHQSEMLDKELEISRLKNRLAMEELKQAIMDLELKICDWSNHWSNHWRLDTVESEE